ncbi:DUF418 domain-containing protein [Sphingomicrobium astaxanthinifaciens]|uniref:DUF418 domain-containing protein n=1 Tax=Sphingomicrobium astaxanthinifaciens TaxID=1227949 RepID=UPI001FCA8319|nr:DUF418 domain-containing protein [Sphingomicrobium astaxanthinifaciens]MCJ7421295.1 DUF418 domain-containing protein [Sphingomicrobium astaxanthinifaciens]
MERDSASGAAPVTSAERIGELDILRGFALLGVLIANIVWWNALRYTLLPDQMDAHFADPVQRNTLLLVNWLVSDKANTLFAFLFGMGFWVQMQRLEARGVDFAALYRRRIGILLALGVAHLFLLWPWDILHMYALMGFALFALRGLSMRAMLVGGAVLALGARPFFFWLRELLGLEDKAEAAVLSPDAIAERQAAFLGSDYGAWITEVARLHWHDYLGSGIVAGWLLYVLGRFLLGAWVARKGWLQRAGELLPAMRRLCLACLPLGLLLEALYTAMEFGIVHKVFFVAGALHAVGVPLLAIGYATGLILLFHRARWGWLPRLFAPVGRMALTNYIAQSVMMFFLLYGIGGLAMTGRLAPTQTLAIAFGFFALQVLFSHWWLGRYRFGPLEYGWRTLTYGERSGFRRQPA